MLLGVVAFLGMAYFFSRVHVWSEAVKRLNMVDRAENNILAREQARKNINARRNKSL